MTASLAAKPLCARCDAPMDVVETVAVLTSLEGHVILECVWCGHLSLQARAMAAPGAEWFGACPFDGRRGVIYTPLLNGADGGTGEVPVR